MARVLSKDFVRLKLIGCQTRSDFSQFLPGVSHYSETAIPVSGGLNLQLVMTKLIYQSQSNHNQVLLEFHINWLYLPVISVISVFLRDCKKEFDYNYSLRQLLQC